MYGHFLLVQRKKNKISNYLDSLFTFVYLQFDSDQRPVNGQQLVRVGHVRYSTECAKAHHVRGASFAHMVVCRHVHGVVAAAAKIM